MQQLKGGGLGKRIIWIDIAKFFAIISVIIGHSFARNTFLWRVIYSYHMPLFFVLSGYTMNVPKSFSEITSYFIKLFKKLILPVFIIIALRMIFNIIIFQFSMEYFFQQIKEIFLQLLYSSGAEHKNFPYVLGGPWFLVALFYAKIIYFIILYYFKDYDFPLCLILGFLGIVLGERYILMQEFDVVLLVIFFLSFGRHLKLLFDLPIKMYYVNIIIFCAFIIWSLFFYIFNVNIEIATRHYPLGIISVLTALSMVVFICIFSAYIEKLNLYNILILYIGRSTLFIFIIHNFDYILVKLLSLLSINNIWMIIVSKLIFDCFVGVFINICLLKKNGVINCK